MILVLSERDCERRTGLREIYHIFKKTTAQKKACTEN